MLGLAACGLSEEAEPTPVPPSATPRPTDAPDPTDVPTPTAAPTLDYSDVLTLPSRAAETPEETFDMYLNDSIEQQVSIRREKLDMRARYQNPSAFLQELEGLVLDIELIENRSRRTILREANSTFEVEIDVRVTFADGDTSTLTCAWLTNLEKSGNRWYVVNPTELLLFDNCA